MAVPITYTKKYTFFVHLIILHIFYVNVYVFLEFS